jgi:hypothetical protein
VQLSQRVRDCIKLCNDSLPRPTPIICLAFVQVFQLLLQVVQTSMARIPLWRGANVGRVIDVIFNEPVNFIALVPETNIEGAEGVLVCDSILENRMHMNGRIANITGGGTVKFSQNGQERASIEKRNA